jgi:hypothetical protein
MKVVSAFCKANTKQNNVLSQWLFPEDGKWGGIDCFYILRRNCVTVSNSKFSFMWNGSRRSEIPYPLRICPKI